MSQVFSDTEDAHSHVQIQSLDIRTLPQIGNGDSWSRRVGRGLNNPKRVRRESFSNSGDLHILLHIFVAWYNILSHNTGDIGSFIRIQYTPSFEHGRYKTNSEFEAMLAIDLAVTRASVDLNPLYNKWGLESVVVSKQNDHRVCPLLNYSLSSS